MLETIIYDGLVLLILFTIFVFQFLIASFVVYSFIEAIYPKEKGKMLLYMFIADLFLLSALLITYGILNLLITYGILNLLGGFLWDIIKRYGICYLCFSKNE